MDSEGDDNTNNTRSLEVNNNVQVPGTTIEEPPSLDDDVQLSSPRPRHANPEKKEKIKSGRVNKLKSLQPKTARKNVRMIAEDNLKEESNHQPIKPINMSIRIELQEEGNLPSSEKSDAEKDVRVKLFDPKVRVEVCNQKGTSVMEPKESTMEPKKRIMEPKQRTDTSPDVAIHMRKGVSRKFQIDYRAFPNKGDIILSMKLKMPKEQMPKEQMPKEQMPKEQMPKEQMPKEQMPKEQMPKEQMPKEQMPKEQIPKEQIPKEQMPKDQMPKEQMPIVTDDSEDSERPGPCTSSSANASAHEIVCPICRESLYGKEVISTYCGHIFCNRCMTDTLRSRNRKCPTCRERVSVKHIHKLYL